MEPLRERQPEPSHRVPRSVALIASALTTVMLLGVLGVGALWVTTDWSALACFDGDEPACQDPPTEKGLGAVQASSWLLAASGIGAVAASFVLALRMKRPQQLGIVLVLCALSIGVTTVLFERL